MTKKDYERAAEIIQRWASVAAGSSERDTVAALETCFAEFFSGDSPRFDEARFRAACAPGANVKARGKRSVV